MRLTVHTDYALRMLMYLALKQDGLATISEIAARYGISKNHLMKVAYRLGTAGYIDTVRGRGGGLRLAKSAEAIGLGDIVRQTEPDMALVPCFKPVEANCAILPSCALRGALGRAGAAFLRVLDEYSLGDLVKQRAPLRNLLSIEPIRRPAARVRA
jgi:Rrf2 family nitric oxide-sensitive transcriptional repressor